MASSEALVEAPSEPCSGVILAGGYGSRLGRDKASAQAAGRSLLHWTADALASVCGDIVVVARAGQDVPALDCVPWRVVRDRRSETGPLAGIEAALSCAAHDLALVVATDMPLLRPDLLRAVAAACHGVDVAMPRRDGRAEPLLAAYRRSCLPVITAMLEQDERRPRALLDLVRSRTIDVESLRRHDPDLESFTNINIPGDLERVGVRLQQRAAVAGDGRSGGSH